MPCFRGASQKCKCDAVEVQPSSSESDAVEVHPGSNDCHTQSYIPAVMKAMV